MNILLLSSPHCYPCEKGKSELRKLLKKYPQLEAEITVVERPNEAFPKYNIVYTPTFLVDSEKPGLGVKILSGAHKVTKIEMEGLLKDLGILQ